MSFSRLPTHLGGELKNLEWEDLTPTELVTASWTSSTKARLALEVAEAQIDAASIFGDGIAANAYRDARWILQRVVSIDPR